MMNNKKAILVVSFGTSYNSSRSITIGAIESTIREFFPDCEVRRAFTSGMIIGKLEKRDGIRIDTVPKALTRLLEDGYSEIYIQPTHMIHGDEYDLIRMIVDEYKDSFNVIKLGRALLSDDNDLHDLAKILDHMTSEWADEKTARVFMGHGTEHSINTVYTRLQEAIDAENIRNMYIATVEASPSVNDIVEKIRGTGIKRVLLSPLMIVAGDHAVNDMAGDCEDSWKSILKKEGFEVCCRVCGLGSFYEVQQMIVHHCQEMLEKNN